MSELAKRWAVALVGIPVVLGLLYAGGWSLAVPVAAMAAIGASEFYGMATRAGVAPLPWVGTVGAAGLVLCAAWRPTFDGFAAPALALLVIVAGLSLLGAIAFRQPQDKPLAGTAVTLFGLLYVGLPMSFVPLLHALPDAYGWSSGSPWAGAFVVALPLAATWLGDAVAFFAGSAWGSGGLAPSISPNKSWVGAWGGLVGAGVAAAVWMVATGSSLPGLPLAGLLPATLVGVVLGTAAILGDLAESLLKRDAGVKDSGTFFPGHGGVLDRLDALIFTLPTAYAALLAIEIAT